MKRIFYILISSVLVLFAYPLLADEHEEESVLSNDAQVQKAQNLSDAALEDGKKSDDPELSEAQANLAQAEEDLANLPDDATEEEINTAKDAVLAAEDEFLGLLGATTQDIEDRREEGMGWGEIAHDLGLHPSFLGLGHLKDKSRERDSESFATSSSSKDNGNSKSIGLKGKASFSSEDSNKGGNSFGKGNSGNKGGNSSGKGNGNGKK